MLCNENVRISLACSRLQLILFIFERDVTAGLPNRWYPQYSTSTPMSSLKQSAEIKQNRDPHQGKIPCFISVDGLAAFPAAEAFPKTLRKNVKLRN